MLTLVERAMHGPFVTDDADGRGDVLDTVQRLAKILEVEAYVVGGPVRDQLLGIPYNDLDITVAGSALPLAEQLGNRGGRSADRASTVWHGDGFDAGFCHRPGNDA